MAEVAPTLAVAAGVTAVVSGVLLGVFFATGRDAWGRANDITSAAFALMLVPMAILLGDRYSDATILSWAVAALGIVGLVVAAAASTLTAFGRLTVRQLMTWQGGAFGVVFGWVGLSSILMLGDPEMPPALPWMGLASAGLTVVVTIEAVRLARRPGGMEQFQSMTRPPVLLSAALLMALVLFPAWCIWLGLSL